MLNVIVVFITVHVGADPNYKPVHVVSTTSSRIPVKTATQKKFEKAHQKNFNKYVCSTGFLHNTYQISGGAGFL